MEMTPKAFVKRLQIKADKFGLTASDLAIWLGRPRPTVLTWLRDWNEPKPGAVLDECVRRLKLLSLSRAFPVPYSVLQMERPKYIRKAYDDANSAGVSARGAPARREILRNGHRTIA
jgi:hypothetical protein